MKREDKQMILIYTLIFILIVLIILLTKTVINSIPKEEPKKKAAPTQKMDISPYPQVNEECTFDVTLNEYNSLTTAGCEDGYTRYNITDVNINDNNLKVSIVYSDKGQLKTGLFINDKKYISNIETVAKIKFGIFDNKLFILNMSINDINALAFNSSGIELFNLKTTLEKEKITDLSTGDTTISTSTLNPNTFIFTEGIIEFDSISNNCQNGEKTSGSHYKVTYTNESFEKPEFVALINCP